MNLDGLVQLIDEAADALVDMFHQRGKRWVWCSSVILIMLIIVLAFTFWLLT
jgi:hypothetical protein